MSDVPITSKVEAKKKSSATWPRWKIGLALLTGFGTFAALLALIPSYSTGWAMVGIMLTIIGLSVALRRVGPRRKWWEEVTVAMSFQLYFIFMGARAWTELFGMPVLWIVLLLALYAFVWALPTLAPRLSAILFREQIAPETTVGRGCMTVALIIGPAAGGIAAVVGRFGRQHFFDKFPMLAIGLASVFLILTWGQYVAHQLWPKRPWAEREQG